MIQKVKNLIAKSKTSLIGSIDEDGFPNIKAFLAPRKIVDLKEFYFSTNTSSMRVIQFRSNSKSALYFYSLDTFEGVMLKGTMEVLEDAQSKEMIWQDGDTLYYPKGVADPDYCVLRFTVKSGRYYSNFKSVNF